jgi:hypothetical protein
LDVRVLGISSWEGGAERLRLLAIIALPCILAVTAVKAEDLEHCYEAAGKMLVGTTNLPSTITHTASIGAI